MTKHQAFLRQARSDFEVFKLLSKQDRSDVPECHPLHYLQMATEKIAKAILIKRRRDPGETHVALSKFSHVLKRRDVATRLGWTHFDSFLGFLKGIAPTLLAIERLNPKEARDGPNVEYPWESPAAKGIREWQVPADYPFGLLDALRRNGARVDEFVTALITHFDGIFR